MTAVLFSLATLLLSVNTGPIPPPTRTNVAVPGPPRTDLAREGADLYAVHCLQCHGADLRGTSAAPALQSAGAAGVDFELATGRMPLEVPGTEPDRGAPAFDAQQIAALVAFAEAHGVVAPAIPDVRANDALARGRKLYESNCQACHGASADGATVGYGWIAPGLREATPLQIAEAVRFGPGVMPRFDTHAMPSADLDALVAYVETLDRAPHPGGISLASAGPVGEGLFAWIVGIGLATAVMRYVGETASPRDAAARPESKEAAEP